MSYRTETILWWVFCSFVYLVIGFFVIGFGHVFGIGGLGPQDAVVARDFGLMLLWPLVAIKWLVIGLFAGLGPALSFIF